MILTFYAVGAIAMFSALRLLEISSDEPPTKNTFWFNVFAGLCWPITLPFLLSAWAFLFWAWIVSVQYDES